MHVMLFAGATFECCYEGNRTTGASTSERQPQPKPGPVVELH